MTPVVAKVSLALAMVAVLTGAVQSGTGNGLVCVSATCMEAPAGLGALLAWTHRLATVGLTLSAFAGVARFRSWDTVAATALILALGGVGLASEVSLLAPLWVSLHTLLSLMLVALLAHQALAAGDASLSRAQMPLVVGVLIYASAFSATVGWHSAAACELWPLCENPEADPLLSALQAGSAVGIAALVVAFGGPIWSYARELGFAAKALPRAIAFAALAELMIVVSDQLQGIVIGRLLIAHGVMATSAWLFVRLGWLAADGPATSALPSPAPRAARELRT
jgi:hypothetical protein